MTPPHISDTGLALIKRFEGLRLQAYKDPVGVVTIGYGHTKTARLGQQISEADAEALLRQDIEEFEHCVRQVVQVPIEQHQFDALVSFAFNLGCGALGRSTLLDKLNDFDYSGAANELPRWNRAGNRVLRGLVRRRAAERDLFLNA